MPAELTLIAPGGIRTALEQLLPSFERASGDKVTPTFTSGGATKAKTIEGELFDVPVVQPPLDQVIASGNVVTRSETPIATVSVVLAVHAGAPKPDISNPEAVKKLLLAAKSISCPSVARGAACGVSFEATLTALGIKEAVAPKIVAAPSGWESMKMLGRGEVELGVTFASENDPNPDVTMLGPMPRTISVPTGFVAFVHARSKAPDAAAALIRFLSSTDAAEIFVACGMTPGK
ncbi:MAG TPA: substrate-binding domain-containing protein [Stellaceae bacterium]|jgi:molybdate transport system substrate-binding protein|nr:substrate-binding domain-containing protein [Stellaceae bacterium]